MKITKHLLIIPLTVFAVLPILSNAQVGLDIGVKGRVDIGHDNKGHDDDKNNMRYGSSTKDWNHSTSSTSTKQLPPRVNNFGGTVVATSSNSFTLSSVGRNGTTTTVIYVDTNTAFRTNTGTSTLANLTIGQKVSVIGNTASASSTTIVAAKVNLLPDSANVDNRNKGFFNRFFGWLRRMF